MELDRLKDIRIRGFAKLFHRLFMGLTYPLRHPFRFLAFLLVLVLILVAVPLIKGVSWRQIPAWYSLTTSAPQKVRSLPQPDVVYQPIENESEEQVAPKTESIVLEHPFKPQPPKEYKPMKLPQNWEEGRAEGLNLQEIQAKSQQPVLIPMLSEEPVSDTVVAETSEEIGPSLEKEAPVQAEAQPAPKPSYRVDTNLPLVYEENPKHIQGKAFVFSANELTVGKTYLYLYGIYTDADKYNPQEAQAYLENLVRGQTLDCDLVAYTYQHLATGICYINGQSVNQNMVDKGFADNVAL